MSVTFYVDTDKNRSYLRLPMPTAGHMLTALAYDLHDVADSEQLWPDDLMLRIAAMRRQFALGRGREFTAPGMEEKEVLRLLEELECVAGRALEGATKIVLL